MVISSLVVETTTDYTSDVAETLATLDGVEVHGVEGTDIVVTIEAETLDDSHDVASSFVGITGVLNVNLIYANFEDDPSLVRHPGQHTHAEGIDIREVDDDDA